MRNIKNNKGYTIIELLAVVSILVIISGIITAILYSTLRGSNKAKVTTEVVQNGDYALSVITNTVNDSRNVLQIGGVDINDCTASPSGTSITLRRLDGNVTTLSCSGDTVSSDSASLLNTDQVETVENTCFFYCNQKADDLYALPIVGVIFQLKQVGDGGTAESQSSANFETSITLSNYRP